MKPLALGVSYRRALLDDELLRLAPSLSGVVLDVGGRRPVRGSFRAPIGQTKAWIVVNVAAEERPDVVADAGRLPVRAGTADWVLCLEVLQYVERPEAVMAEIARVLTPGGRAVLAAPFLHRADGPADRHRFTAVRLVELVGHAGLAIVHIVPQGAFFTTVANFLRQAAAHIRRGVVRYPIGSLVMPLGWLLRRADRLPGVSGSAFLGSFTTGFVVVARKP